MKNKLNWAKYTLFGPVEVSNDLNRVLHGISLYCMVLCCMVLNCIRLHCMVLHGIAFDYLLWYCMVFVMVFLWPIDFLQGI